MIDWQRLKRYCRWNLLTRIVLILIAYPLILCFSVAEKWYFLCIIGAVFLLFQMVLLYLKRWAAIPKKCRHCESLLTQSEWTLLFYGRCQNCRRKLVRDDDFNHSGGTAASSDGKKDAIFPRTLTDPGKTETRK